MNISSKKIQSRNIHRNNNSSGFTIVETLIAITILMIAIAGPLVIATKSLNTASASKNQMIASYLAQESMEMIKNQRDANVSAGAPTGWLDGFDYPTDCNLSTNTQCDINGIDKNLDYIASCQPSGCSIYFNSATGYNHSNIGSDSGFKRRFYFQSKPDNNGKKEVLVHVFVNWNEGTVPYEIYLTSQLVETSR